MTKSHILQAKGRIKMKPNCVIFLHSENSFMNTAQELPMLGKKKRFMALTLDYMSEESSSDGGESMFVHQSPWRSNRQY